MHGGRRSGAVTFQSLPPAQREESYYRCFTPAAMVTGAKSGAATSPPFVRAQGPGAAPELCGIVGKARTGGYGAGEPRGAAGPGGRQSLSTRIASPPPPGCWGINRLINIEALAASFCTLLLGGPGRPCDRPTPFAFPPQDPPLHVAPSKSHACRSRMKVPQSPTRRRPCTGRLQQLGDRRNPPARLVANSLLGGCLPGHVAAPNPSCLHNFITGGTPAAWLPQTRTALVLYLPSSPRRCLDNSCSLSISHEARWCQVSSPPAQGLGCLSVSPGKPPLPKEGLYWDPI